MKYIIIVFLVLIIISFLIWYLLKRKRAIHKVKCTSKEEKLCYINAALSPFGFTFDSCQDIVVSKNDCWQREIGYRDLYDLESFRFNIVMDSEPIYFHYNKKEYRIEFWKGQYGITTGAEIGIYIRDDDCKLPHHHYRSATDKERLEMGFVLSKNCVLFKRKDLSWWLTGFDVGKFSKPKDLQLKSCICFPNCEMKEAFIKGLLKAGYSKSKIMVCENTVCFEYCCPKNYPLNHGHKIRKFIAQICNFINCSIYMFFTRPFPITLDKLTYIRFMFPHLFCLILHFSIPKQKKKKYNKNKKKCHR